MKVISKKAILLLRFETRLKQGLQSFLNRVIYYPDIPAYTFKERAILGLLDKSPIIKLKGDHLPNTLKLVLGIYSIYAYRAYEKFGIPFTLYSAA